MATIRKATVKSYDVATHRATVQIAGSLGVWLDNIRVATDIPAADVVAGRQCTVLFLDPANQDDAVVLTIQGSLPSTPSGATVAASATVVPETTFGQASAPGVASPYSRGDHTHGTPADPGGGVTDHGALTGLADDDHTQYGALAQAETWAALQTFSEGLKLAASKAIKDSGGTDRITLATASPHVTLAGEIRAGDKVGIGAAPATMVLNVSAPTATGAPAGILQLTGNQTPNANVGSIIALDVNAGILHGAFTVSEWIGMKFSPAVSGSAAITNLYGIQSRGTVISAPITSFAAFHAGPISTLFNPAIANQYGLLVVDRGTANTTNVFGVRVDEITAGANRYLGWFGGSAPNLRIDAGAPTNAGLTTEGDSKVYAAWTENGVITVRQLRWRKQSSLGAADKVLIAA